MAYIGNVPVDVTEASFATIDNFAAGVGFTAGSSTTVTLTSTPASENSLLVSMDGVTQHHNTYAVSGTKDEVALEDHGDKKKGDMIVQSVDYGEFTPLLTAAMQELITKVETLEQDNIALRARVTNLEGN